MPSLKKIIFCLLLFIPLFNGKAQTTDKIEETYASKKGIDKISFYESLTHRQKLDHLDFLYQNLLKLSADEQINSDTKSSMRLKFALAEIHVFKQEDLKTIITFKEILNNKDYKLPDSKKMYVLVQLQSAYLNLNLYSNVFKINSEIAYLRKKGVDYPLWSYNNKSSLYARLFLYDKAILQLKSEINEILKNPKRDSLIVPNAYNNLGFYFFKNNQVDSAYHYYNLSLQKAETALKKNDFGNYSTLSGLVKGNMGILKMKQGDYKNALPLLMEDLSISLKIKDYNNNNDGIVKNIINLSTCNIKLKNFTEAQKNIQLAEQLIPKGISPETKVFYYKTKAELLKAQNKKDEAFTYNEKAFNLSDSINSKKQRLLLAGNEILYQLEEKDNVIEKQQSDINAKEKGILYIVATALGIILMTTLLYLNNSRKKQKEIQQKNDEISAKNETIKESLAEKEMLLKEIHHRVKNNLQIISGILELQNLNIIDENAKVILKEGQSRIQSIALIHKTLYQSENFSKVPFQNYLSELIQAIQSAFHNNTKINIDVEANEIELGINTAIPLSLIINEIMTNCFKHAFKNRENGNIKINLTKENDIYKLIVKDDGIGLSEDFNPKKLQSIGFDLIIGLTRQLEGNFDWKNNNGTTIIITFKDIV
ncbi:MULTISPECIES: sensor histidine kinase [Flavobacterium]|uniref:sensor histidine kinase n=1 Tax=Flavobacterium TaxID=237 RepID=UPI001FCC61DA|nr:MULTISPECIES: sensor histidine kinase [Flavobacterium]UOK41871.1 sensor histidine kinase [Flavobacterium enshiense]